MCTHTHTHTHCEQHRIRGIIAYSSELGEDICAYSEFNDTIPRLIGGIINTLLATGSILHQTMPKPTIADYSIYLPQFSGTVWVY